MELFCLPHISLYHLRLRVKAGGVLGALQNNSAETELVPASPAGVLGFGTEVLPHYEEMTVCAKVQ